MLDREMVRSDGPVERPRLIAVDVDDTLLEGDLTLSEPCADALKRAMEAGVHVVLATGRMYQSALPYARQLGLDGYLIAYNGALVRKIDGETLWHRPVPKEHALEMVDAATEEGYCLNLYLDDELIVETLDDERVTYYLGIAGVKAHPVGDLKAALEGGEPTKCLLVGDAERVPSTIAKLQDRFPDLQISRSKPRFIEVTQKGVRKDAALKAVAESMGVPMSSVMAVGDGENDATMLAAVGWGVAVANASAGPKAAADYVTNAERGLGVHEAVERFVLGS